MGLDLSERTPIQGALPVLRSVLPRVHSNPIRTVASRPVPGQVLRFRRERLFFFDRSEEFHIPSQFCGQGLHIQASRRLATRQ